MSFVQKLYELIINFNKKKSNKTIFLLKNIVVIKVFGNNAKKIESILKGIKNSQYQYIIYNRGTYANIIIYNVPILYFKKHNLQLYNSDADIYMLSFGDNVCFSVKDSYKITNNGIIECNREKRLSKIDYTNKNNFFENFMREYNISFPIHMQYNRIEKIILNHNDVKKAMHLLYISTDSSKNESTRKHARYELYGKI